MTVQDLRKKFIDFFVARGHKQLPPAFLVSKDDPSVLFTTAGMQQFKQFYLDPGQAPSQRVVTIQPCFRTSDIEEVGDGSHLTFFEMLGNFSFGGDGSYFKKEAINWGLEFLVKGLGLEKDKISASYFAGDKDLKEDGEAKVILEQIGFKGDKLISGNKQDNFWGPVGESGPCGPTVEFYLDGIEIWNLVFNEYVFEQGKYQPAKFQGVDTGMGLERTLAILENKASVFETELFRPLIKAIEKNSQDPEQKSLRIAADHLKAAVFLAKEGLMPANKEQGYLLRRLIRRALVHLKLMQFDMGQFLHFPAAIFNIYQIGRSEQEKILSVLQKEKELFGQTLQAGMKQFEKLVSQSTKEISGSQAFHLFETFGFPLELTQELAKEHQKTVDESGFRQALEQHRQKSRASSQKFRGGLASGGEMETRYHTANHLLLAALRRVLGPHVTQKGSNINSERLRFDFSHPEKLTPEQIKKVEDMVNEKIKENLPVRMQEMGLAEARAAGATGVFDERYGDKVKVYSIGPSTGSGQAFSQEICGGPHVKSTGQIGRFKIIKQESSSAGIRRLRAHIS